MYTATQARNIANERYHHKYYNYYRWFVSTINYGIRRAVKRGLLRYQFYAPDAKHLTMSVLRQIADEFTEYNYRTEVMIDARENGKHKRGLLTISWAE